MLFKEQARGQSLIFEKEPNNFEMVACKLTTFHQSLGITPAIKPLKELLFIKLLITGFP